MLTSAATATAIRWRSPFLPWGQHVVAGLLLRELSLRGCVRWPNFNTCYPQAAGLTNTASGFSVDYSASSFVVFGPQ